MTITLTTLKWVPKFAQGLVRDLRVRWALEEAGLAYQEELIDFPVMATKDYRERQPFGQVPVYREGELSLFESGAIVLHIGAKTPVLLPEEPVQRALAVSWVFAAVNSVEPPLQQLAGLDLFYSDKDWAAGNRVEVLEMARKRLKALEEQLGDRDYLEKGFTVGDLMMGTVLRIPRHCDLLEEYPTLVAYKKRLQARPAFVKAMKDHMAPFKREGR